MAYRKSPVIKPPFGGWIDAAPAALARSGSFKQITNWMIRYNRITPFFQTVQWSQQASLAPNVLMAGRTFTDQQGFVHTIFLTNTGWGEIIPAAPGNTYTTMWRPWPPTYPAYTDANLFGIAVFNGMLFCANGFIPLTYFIGDGNAYALGPLSPPAAAPPAVPPTAPAGTVPNFPGSCYFLCAFTDRLMAINTVEPTVNFPGATNYPTRIRYCAVNNPWQWDSNVDTTAGLIQITDAEDALSGMVIVNQTGFAFRKNGITAISATGNQLIPFFIENFSVGPDGVGAFLPYTLSAYGTVASFVSQDDVYTFSGGAPQTIGGPAKRSIFRDLGTASSTPFGRMVGSFGSYVDYLTYWLAIPQANDTFTSMWIYHFDDSAWINVHWPYGAERCVANVATA